VRDKGSRPLSAKGIWVGGPGAARLTRPVDKKIVVVESRGCCRFRTILGPLSGSLAPSARLAEDPRLSGHHSQHAAGSSSKRPGTLGGRRFGVGALAYLLKEPLLYRARWVLPGRGSPR